MKGLFGGKYSGRKVLMTGHTGFKGSWMTKWLELMGAEVHGISNEDFDNTRHFESLDLNCKTYYGDIRDRDFLFSRIESIQPEIVFHLAAQALVRDSYRDPFKTYETNVMGSLNVLEACQKVDSITSVVNVTTDKVYENLEAEVAYKETDPLGGHDPYSSSKAASEILTSSYRRSFLTSSDDFLLASARAGNVIGGGDWANERLVPDLVRSVENGTEVEIRSPYAVRPWQHVLEPLSGYLLLGSKLLGADSSAADAWNFGPARENCVTVEEVVSRMKDRWSDIGVTMNRDTKPEFHEAGLLILDSGKAIENLGWGAVWNLDKTADHVTDWYQKFITSGEVLTTMQIEQFVADAAAQNLAWAKG